jgi:hypothetical protein
MLEKICELWQYLFYSQSKRNSRLLTEFWDVEQYGHFLEGLANLAPLIQSTVLRAVDQVVEL